MLMQPHTIEDYIHRIGRTGRAGAKGVSISFMTDKHARLARDLVGILREAQQNVPPQLMQMGGGGGGGSFNRYSAGGGGGRRY